jgi:hypothetical protein
MALNIGPVDVVDPGDIFFLDPFAVEVPVGRKVKATDDAILEMAISFHKYGQRRAVECCNREGHLLLEHGYIRLMAARLTRSGFSYVDSETKQQVKVKDRRFALKAVLLSSPT